jgi:type VI secretion system secreted protein VgrG
MAGCLFKLTNYPREDQNREYLITAASYNLGPQEYESAFAGGGGSLFSCSITAIDKQQVYRAPRITPKPIVQGPQTAIVVGKSGEEIWTDQYGRVKVQFHWDRYGKEDENSSCWIRVSQVHAGKGFGGIDIPRIGEEVIVSCLEGDPDRPIITGRVYNDDNKPPTGLPSAGMVSGLKSNSTPGGGGYNEMVMDDTSGSEKITIHGQYNMDTTVENDQTLTVNNNRTTTIAVDDAATVGSNQTKDVGADYTETIGANKTIQVGANHTENIGANMSLTVSSNKTETVSVASAETVGAAKALTIGAAYQISVGAAMNETVGAAKAEEIGGIKSVNVGANSSENIGKDKSVSAGSNISEKAGKDVSVASGKKMALTAGDDLAIQGNKKGVIELADELTIKCGKATIVMKKNGDVTINGKKITVKGSGDVVIKGSKIKQN